MGVLLSPLGGTEHEGLFHKTGQVLYVSERHGKSDMVFYSRIAELECDLSALKTTFYVIEIHHDITPDYRVDPHLVFEAMEKFLASGGSPGGMDSALKMIGRVSSVGRACLAECSGDCLQCIVACEWCALNVELVFGKAQKFPLEKLGLHYQRFNEWGLFRCYGMYEAEDTYSLRQSPPTRSILHCVLYNQWGSIRGFVGRDNVTTNHIWNRSESASLMVLAGSISRLTYYYKEVKEKSEREIAPSAQTEGK